MAVHPIKMVVTTALPYANADLHLGHALEYIQADIWVRAQRLAGNQPVFLCADDAHGTPIMLAAQAAGKTPEEYIEKIADSHKRSMDGLNISFDHFHSTHSEENRQLTTEIYRRLKTAGMIKRQQVEQWYDAEQEMFLADRMVKGQCPVCAAEDQYSDNCEACGATYSSMDVKEPYSTLTDSQPVRKTSEHLFFDLPECEQLLQQWMQDAEIDQAVVNKLQEWFDQGLKPWDISRDKPYFGFQIPGEVDKYLYVWVDAPVGYMASLLYWCQQNGQDIDQWWGSNSDAEIYHFIGKDIAYFHSLFWPAVLHHSDYKKPDGIFVHGFLSVNDAKMSKSRGTFILVDDYLQHLDVEPLRYFFASRLSDGIVDMDLKFSDLSEKFNSDIVGKVVNIASRSSKILQKNDRGRLGAPQTDDGSPYESLLQIREQIQQQYRNRRFDLVVRMIADSAMDVNKYLEQHAPWTAIKGDEQQRQQALAVCSTAIHCFRLLIHYLKPIMPQLADTAQSWLGDTAETWSEIDVHLPVTTLLPYTPLATRIAKEKILAVQG